MVILSVCLSFKVLIIWNRVNLTVQAPPCQPHYPEPQPVDQGRFLLDPKSHDRLPPKFHNIKEGRVIVVHSNGALKVTESAPFYWHASQWTHYDGYGGYIDDYWYTGDLDATLKFQGIGRRWSHLPWTTAQEKSCRTLKVRFQTPIETVMQIEHKDEAEAEETFSITEPLGTRYQDRLEEEAYMGMQTAREATAEFAWDSTDFDGIGFLQQGFQDETENIADEGTM